MDNFEKIMFLFLAFMAFSAVILAITWNWIHPTTCVTEIKDLVLDDYSPMVYIFDGEYEDQKIVDYMCEDGVETVLSGNIVHWSEIRQFYGKGKCYIKTIKCEVK
jgi:hypothetical protein